jgi:hypothetical protein
MCNAIIFERWNGPDLAVASLRAGSLQHLCPREPRVRIAHKFYAFVSRFSSGGRAFARGPLFIERNAGQPLGQCCKPSTSKLYCKRLPVARSLRSRTSFIPKSIFCGMSSRFRPLKPRGWRVCGFGHVFFVSVQSSSSFRLRPLVTFRLWWHKWKLSETDRLKIGVAFLT